LKFFCFCVLLNWSPVLVGKPFEAFLFFFCILSFQRDTCQIYCCSLNEHTSDQERQKERALTILFHSSLFSFLFKILVFLKHICHTVLNLDVVRILKHFYFLQGSLLY
jgi:hypothetical protein